jgi:hypothetical protein
LPYFELASIANEGHAAWVDEDLEVALSTALPRVVRDSSFLMDDTSAHACITPGAIERD